LAAAGVGEHHAVVAHLLARHLERDHAGQRALGAVLGQRGPEVEVDQRVAAQHQRGVVKKTALVLDVAHAAGRTQRARQDVAVVINALVGVTDLDAPAVPVAKILLDFAVVVGHVDHDLRHAVARQMLDQVFHHRLAQNWHHRFGQVFGQGPNPGALASGQDHCFCHVRAGSGIRNGVFVANFTHAFCQLEHCQTIALYLDLPPTRSHNIVVSR